jgi:hypothetical protein
MVWIGQCGCFKLDVALARRIHPLESARATATVSYPGATYTVVSNFQIRGLAGNGRDFAPGGAAYLATWVSVPRPVDGDTQHFCAWLRTLDDLGIPGVRVRFVVHYRTGAQHWTSVKTNAAGIVCSLRSVGNAAPGVRVFVDAYALGKHARGSFTPRSAG